MRRYNGSQFTCYPGDGRLVRPAYALVGQDENILLWLGDARAEPEARLADVAERADEIARRHADELPSEHFGAAVLFRGRELRIPLLPDGADELRLS